MPYSLVQDNGYFVENVKTKKRYSKRPMTKENAIKQLYVLRSHMPHESGSGLFSEVKDRLSGFIDGVRLDFPPNSRNVIKMYGEIKKINIYIIFNKYNGRFDLDGNYYQHYKHCNNTFQVH